MIFSGGQRICIGRQAALVEATAYLARVVAKYKIEPPAAETDKWKARAGESEMDRRQRIYNVSCPSCELFRTGVLTVNLHCWLQASHAVTLKPASPLKVAFVPRV